MLNLLKSTILVHILFIIERKGMKKNPYILDSIMLRGQGLSQRKLGLSTVKNKKNYVSMNYS